MKRCGTKKFLETAGMSELCRCGHARSVHNVEGACWNCLVQRRAKPAKAKPTKLEREHAALLKAARAVIEARADGSFGLDGNQGYTLLRKAVKRADRAFI